MASRLIEFDAQSVIRLLTHYSEGQIPLSAEVKAVQISKILPRWIAISVDSPEWEDQDTGQVGYGGQEPLFFRYEGKRVMTLDNRKDPITWSEENAVERPKLQ